jgi:Uma2 family endonuclease
MSAIPNEPIRMTESEYLEFERQSEFKHEYINGEVFAMAGASRAHSLICGNLMAILKAQLRGRGCEVHDSNFRLKVEATGLLTYPDLSVICGEVQMAESVFDTLLNPILLIEVLSPSTKKYDRTEKFSDYRKIPSFKEYVLVAQDKAHIERYLRREDGIWELKEVEGLEAKLELSSIGVTLSLADVYEQVSFEKEPPKQ